MDSKDSTPPTPTSTTPIIPKEIIKSQNSLVLILIAVVLLLLGIVGYLAYQNMTLQKQISDLSSTPSPAPSILPSASASGSPDATSNWQVYLNKSLGFQIKYPEDYKPTDDRYGWPNAVFILYKGGQSYDLIIESWNSEADYKSKYATSLNRLVVKEVRNKFITLLNNNSEPEVDLIIGTFEEVK